MNKYFKRMVRFSYAFVAFTGFSAFLSYAAEPPQRPQFHYVMIQSAGIGPIHNQMQQYLYQFIKQHYPQYLSKESEFGITKHFRYMKDLHPPHISLYQVPVDSGYAPDQLATTLRSILNDPNTTVPSTFRFDHLEAFLPEGSTRLWIVVRTPSTMHQGFFQLTEKIKKDLTIPRFYEVFKAHLTLGFIDKAVGAGPWQPREVEQVRQALKGFGLPDGNFPVNEITLSFHKSLSRGPAVLWCAQMLAPAPAKHVQHVPGPARHVPRPAPPPAPVVVPRPIAVMIHPSNEYLGNDYCALFNYKNQQYKTVNQAYKLLKKGDNDWKLMFDLVFAKFSQNVNLIGILLVTGQAPIINNSTHPFWGMGRDGNGQNELGTILQIVRFELQR